jgi:hypothetical protein
LADFVDSTVKEIERRLAELRQEVQRLEGALTALGGGRRGPGRPRGTTTRRTRSATTRSAAAGSSTPTRRRRRRAGAPRGRRGGNTRANQALELVRSKPGVTIPVMAKEMGIEPNYLYRVLPKLVEEKKVRREGQGWHAAE